MIALRAAFVLMLLAVVASAEVLPKPNYGNSFCLFPIDEGWHLRQPGDREELIKVAAAMRATLGPERLYARLGVAVISEGSEYDAYELAKELGLGLVLQGGAIEHHSVAWGFLKLLRDPQQGDRRFAQWFQDGTLADPGKADDVAFGLRACSSIYAKPVYELRRAAEVARAGRVAEAMRRYPETVLACSGPIECEMHQGDNRWGDYSPFTIAEFRDYLTHRGIYAPGAERGGMGWPGGEAFAADPTPAEARGDHPSFNATFGTHFTTWTLRYWDPERFPERLPLEVPGMPGDGERGFVAGGFDSPRVWPGKPAGEGIEPEGNELFWAAWAAVDDGAPGFRAKLLNFWVRDHTRWMAEAGVPRERIYSHQIPGESYGLGRLSAGASAVWTADTPHGSIGITTYFGAASDVDVFQKIVAHNPNWGIFEYHPHPIDSLQAPVDEYLHSLYTCVRFRAHILTPISWPSEGKDFIVATGPFAEAMKQVLAALPDQPYFARAYVDYAPPPVSQLNAEARGGGTHLAWSPLIWPDLRFRWHDWREFDHFAVRDADGRVLAETAEPQADVAAPPAGLTVIAIKRPAPPQLSSVTGLTGVKGHLRWGECYDFFCDHYQVEVYPSATAAEADRVAEVQRARFELRPSGDEKEAWVRVAACDAAGRPGPFTERYRLSLPRPGRPIADLARLRPAIEGSPDTTWRDVAVGGVSQPALFHHPPLQGGGWATATYRLDLPNVATGQRILFAAELGLKDGADQSDGVRFGLELDGTQLLDQLVKPGRPWQPVEVDLTAGAGQAVRLVLRTNPGGSSAADWAAWGGPELLLVGPGVAALPQVTGIVALGKEVRGRVTLRWQDRASDGTLWSRTPGFAAFRVYRGAQRDFTPAADRLLGETRTPEFVDPGFDGRETFYQVTARFEGGTESPASESVQYAP